MKQLSSAFLSIRFSALAFFCAGVCWATLFFHAPASAARFELAINNARVIDPETGLDGIRSIGISNGKIKKLSRRPLRGTQLIDAKGAIVGPGFIDLHAHGSSLLSGRLQAFDGVTTAIEAEVGQLPVNKAYALAEQQGRATNYGWTASWGLARMQVLGGIEPDGTLERFNQALQNNKWTKKATAEQEKEILSLVEKNLKDGALGIGLINGYVPKVSHGEIMHLSQLAAKHNVPIMTHQRFWGQSDPGGDLAATQEIISNAITTGAHWYVCHLSLATASKTQPMFVAAREHGAKISVEALVSDTGSTFLGAEFLAPDVLPYFSRGFEPKDILYYGKPISDAEELTRLRKQDPGALIFLLHRDVTKNAKHRAEQLQSFALPDTILGSDAMPWQHRDGRAIAGDTWPLPEDAWAHPRSLATFTRFIQLWVKEWQEFTVMDAFRLGSYNAASSLENEIPAFKRKGRVQVGADADLIMFSLDDISVRATLQNPLPHSLGMRYVIVAGVPIIEEGELNTDAFPGQAVRRPSQQE
ncbi:MAG: amidohydrolase family protein [Pseudomonadales bacterium]